MSGGIVIVAGIALLALVLWGERLVDRASAAIAAAVDFVGCAEEGCEDPVDAYRREGWL